MIPFASAMVSEYMVGPLKDGQVLLHQGNFRSPPTKRKHHAMSHHSLLWQSLVWQLSTIAGDARFMWLEFQETVLKMNWFPFSAGSVSAVSAKKHLHSLPSKELLSKVLFTNIGSWWNTRVRTGVMATLGLPTQRCCSWHKLCFNVNLWKCILDILFQ